MNINNQGNKQDNLNKESASPVTVNIGNMLTVRGQQENTIGILYNIMGQNYSDKQLHDMHNAIFGSRVGAGSGTDSKVKDLEVF